MVAIELRFPAGRYHATPWDSHVNEGIVEWPPSPWRLLRALVATRYLKTTEAVGADMLQSLVETLSRVLPEYRLPAVRGNFHTRHYMPPFSGNTKKVFDTFLDLPRDDVLQVCWPGITLAPEQRAVLDTLTRHLGYLGRAESWVEAWLLDGDVGDANCRPASTGDEAEFSSTERVRVLAPVPAEDFDEWRAAAIDERVTRALEHKRHRAKAKGKSASPRLGLKDQGAIEASLPKTIMEALQVDTTNMRKEGWSRPPASRWVDYTRPRLDDSLPASRSVAMPRTRMPTVARFALAGNVLPRLTEGLSQAEQARRRLIGLSDGATVFTGKNPDGSPLDGHRHAFFITESNGRHGRVTHVTVHAPMGFDEPALVALRRLRSLDQRGGDPSQIVLLGVGEPDDFGGLRVEAGQCPLFAQSTTWISATPFVPTRHRKLRRDGTPRLDAHGRTIGSPEHDLVRLVTAAGFPEPASIERLPRAQLGATTASWLAFRTERSRGGGRRATRRGFGFRLTFHKPVRGPILVGYAAHFGLGCFLPTADRS